MNNETITDARSKLATKGRGTWIGRLMKLVEVSKAISTWQCEVNVLIERICLEDVNLRLTLTWNDFARLDDWKSYDTAGICADCLRS